MTDEFNYPQSTAVTASPGPTPSQTVGPFFHYALPYELGPEVVGTRRAGAFRLGGRVFDGQGEPIPDSMVEIWQADESGNFTQEQGIYDSPEPTGFRGFGRSATSQDGGYGFRTVKPGRITAPDGTAHAPHIAMAVFARGMLRQAVTRVYFADEAVANANDPLLCGVDEERRDTMIAAPGDEGYRFDVRVQGEGETVFLDVFTQ